jgi:phosphinothricin acetyltransferase
MPEPAFFRLRSCEAADIPAITAIYAPEVLHGTASFETDPPDLAEMSRRREALLAGNYPYLVAEAPGGMIAGYAYAGLYRVRLAYHATVENSVYVHSDMHGRGIGRALLEEVIVQSAARGYRQMVAVIGDSANAASIALHRASGFEMVGTLRSVGWKHGRWLDTVLMQRALGAGDTTPRG